MSALLEFLLELLLDVIGGLLEVWLGEWCDTVANRILWGVILVLLGGVIWWELR
jgi:hypothetical protein